MQQARHLSSQSRSTERERLGGSHVLSFTESDQPTRLQRVEFIFVVPVQ